MAQLYTTYGLKGDPESRLEREIGNIYQTILDAQLEKKQSVPNLTTVPEAKPFLAQDGGNWYIYVKIGNQFHRVQLTAV